MTLFSYLLLADRSLISICVLSSQFIFTYLVLLYNAISFHCKFFHPPCNTRSTTRWGIDTYDFLLLIIFIDYSHIISYNATYCYLHFHLVKWRVISHHLLRYKKFYYIINLGSSILICCFPYLMFPTYRGTHLYLCNSIGLVSSGNHPNSTLIFT